MKAKTQKALVEPIPSEATISTRTEEKQVEERLVLVLFDPIFMKHGAGTYLPLSIAGTRSQPQIKVSWKKLFWD